MSPSREAPPPTALASDVGAIWRLTRRLPALEKLPLPLARGVYRAALGLYSPEPQRWAESSRVGPSLLCFRSRTRDTEKNPAAYLFIHGGGWVLGSARGYGSFCAWLAQRSGADVYALDYRLAPEFPYPAALDDCEAGFAELRKQLGPERPIRLCGDSAGGQLSLALCYRLHAAKKTLPASLRLYYPVLDVPGQTASYRDFAEGPFLSEAMMQKFWRLYALGSDQEENFPLRWKNFGWLPPLTLCLARHDVLFDEGFTLAERLERAGVLAGLHIEADLPHAYLNFMSCASVLAALERQLATPSSFAAARPSFVENL